VRAQETYFFKKFFFSLKKEKEKMNEFNVPICLNFHCAPRINKELKIKYLKSPGEMTQAEIKEIKEFFVKWTKFFEVFEMEGVVESMKKEETSIRGLNRILDKMQEWGLDPL